MAFRDIVVIGASAGGVTLLTDLARALPADLRASVFVVIHTSPSSPGVLPALLNNAGKLEAAFGQNNEPIVHGRIYVGAPDFHLLIRNGRVHITHGPKENGFRPAVDPLFRTAAKEFGSRVIGIVLSGGLDDGTDGLRAIKDHGGIVIVQDPEEADFPSMPNSAIRNVAVDHIVRVAEIPALLKHYSTDPIPKELPMRTEKGEVDIVDKGTNKLQNNSVPGNPSHLTCPECGGALWERRAGEQLRFQCHVGHAYTGEGLVLDVDRGIEQTLWAAVRAMEEAAELRRRMAALAENGHTELMATDYAHQARTLEDQAAQIRELLNHYVNGIQKVTSEKANESKTKTPSKKKKNTSRKSPRA